MEPLKKRLAQLIVEKSFRYSETEPFTLASGRKSPFYFDCKQTTLDPEGMFLIGSIIFGMLEGSEVSAAGGLSLGADPIANAVSLISFQKKRPIKSFIVRKEAKGHGTRNRIEGPVRPGELVAIFDDVATTGASTITAIDVAREAGLVVERVIVLVDREEGGLEAIREQADNVEAVLTRTCIMELFMAEGKSNR